MYIITHPMRVSSPFQFACCHWCGTEHEPFQLLKISNAGNPGVLVAEVTAQCAIAIVYMKVVRRIIAPCVYSEVQDPDNIALFNADGRCEVKIIWIV